jgi:hypothetical protein
MDDINEDIYIFVHICITILSLLIAVLTIVIAGAS